jgi:hypothetical protein
VSAVPVVDFTALAESDLVVGSIYRGGTAGTSADDPLNKLLSCGNMGGFRIVGGKTKGGYRLAALCTTFADEDWPDTLGPEPGRFVYYGDNKKPGQKLHDTGPGGNRLLRHVFDCIHVDPPRRGEVPPFFVFSRTGKGRDVQFHGLAAPGAEGVPEAEDLVATWRTKGSERFQNYRSIFTLLDETTISRSWLEDLVAGRSMSAAAPDAWQRWIENGGYEPTRGDSG